MGDMADYALEQVMEAEEDRFLWLMGGMSEFEAYERGIIDENGADLTHPMFRRRSSTKSRSSNKTCRHCGASGLVWKAVGSKWRLATPDGVIHSCY